MGGLPWSLGFYSSLGELIDMMPLLWADRPDLSSLPVMCLIISLEHRWIHQTARVLRRKSSESCERHHFACTGPIGRWSDDRHLPNSPSYCKQG